MTKRVISNYRMKKGIPAKDVDTYLAQVPPGTRVVLEKLRRIIKATAPKAEEIISYQIPAYKFHGPLVFFAAFKNHCSLFVASKSIVKRFSKELEAFDTSGTTIHFTADNPLPGALIKKLVKTRIEEIESRLKSKSEGK
jgi:uncharacterized protein YdhG (YjbR/CyaY superfamily)